MSGNVLLGNMISLVAAFFTIASSFASGRKRIYGLQVVQCAVMVISSLVFASMSGAVTFVFCAVRNIFLAYDKFDKRTMIVFLVLITGLGIGANNRGVIGLLPVVTTLIYTLGSYYMREDIPIKVNILVNLILWAIYDLVILDFVSCLVDTVSAIATMVAIVLVVRRKDV